LRQLSTADLEEREIGWGFFLNLRCTANGEGEELSGNFLISS